MKVPGAAALVLWLVGCGEPTPAFTEDLRLGDVLVPAAVLNDGARAYALRCAPCHGHDGSGNGPAGYGLRVKPRDFRTADYRYASGGPGTLPTDAEIEAVIRHGRTQNGMPAFPGLSEADLHALVQYLKSLGPRFRHGDTP